MSQIFSDTVQCIIKHETHFHTSKSGGHGGQNVNKRQTKVELLFPVYSSHYLSVDQQNHLAQKAHDVGYMIDKRGILHITAQEERYQHHNKEHAIKKFRHLLNDILGDVEDKPLQHILHGNHYHTVTHPIEDLWKK